jgi:hypothetical protein
MITEAMKLALEALDAYSWEQVDAARAALRTAIEQAEKPVSLQVSPTEFVDMVMDKEDAIGKPIFWAEWPNRETNT